MTRRARFTVRRQNGGPGSSLDRRLSDLVHRLFSALFESAQVHVRFLHPLTIVEATDLVAEWFEQPTVAFAETQLADIHQAIRFLRHARTGGNLVTDAQLAAIALRLGAVVHTADVDFARFPNLHCCNPLA